MPCRGDAVSVDWITTDAELREAVATWGDVIGLDTEFQRTNTFYPIPGLYQVVSNSRVFLLDPLAITDWAPFVRLLEDPEVVLIMHACSEDLELMLHHFGAVPQAVFDTQLAYAFLSANFSTSYANLVLALLAEQLPKHETRSDWLQRPLTREQIRYACEDVVHLPELFEKLRQQMLDLGRLGWFEEVMKDRGRHSQNNPAEHYRSIKKAWRLNGSQLAVLKTLAAWREHQAMAEDVPRNRIVWDEHLLGFAAAEQLAETVVWQALPKPIARRYATVIVEEHERGRREDPLPPLAQPLSQAQGEVSKALRKVARSHAESLDFAQELLARRRDVEECIRVFSATGELSGEYMGWREPLVGDQFRSILKSRS